MQQWFHGFAALDGMRGVAALLIAVRHTDALFNPIAFPESFLAVDLFFALSGAVIVHAYEHRLHAGMSLARFTWIRLVRIYPMYLLGTLLELAALLWTGTAPDLLPRPLLLAALLLPDLWSTLIFPLNPPAWSLFLEMGVNILFAAALPWLTRRRTLAAMALSALLLAALVWAGRRHSLDIGWTARSVGAGVPRVVFSFFAGVLLYRWFRRHGRVRQSSALAWGAVLAVALVLTARPPESLAPFFELAAALAVFPLVVLAGLVFQPGPRSAALFRMAGWLSYPVYAIHVGVGHLVAAAVLAATGQEVSNFAPWIGLPFLLLLLAACAGLERAYDAPVRRWLLARPGRVRAPVL